MPVIELKDLSLQEDDIVRRQGIREHCKTRPEIKSVISELVAMVQEGQLLEGRIVYQLYKIKTLYRDRAQLEEGTVLSGPAFKLLDSADKLATVVCTIGEKLETLVSEYFAKRDPLRGIILDGIGSAEVDSVSQEACRIISEYASSKGYQASSPISPGMPGFPISEQQDLYRLAEADKIGVRLSSSSMLIPRKSVSMVIGIGAEMKRWTQAEVCAHCPINKTCTHRVK